MTRNNRIKRKRKEIKDKLQKVTLPDNGTQSQLLWSIGTTLNVSGPTIGNYIKGNVKDYYLAEAILAEFKKLKMVRK